MEDDVLKIKTNITVDQPSADEARRVLISRNKRNFRRRCLLGVAGVILSLIADPAIMMGQGYNDYERAPESGAIDRIVTSSDPRPAQRGFDDQVVQTTFEKQDESLSLREAWGTEDIHAIANQRAVEPAPDTRRPNFVQRERASRGQSTSAKALPKQQKLGQLISSIGMNLAFVLLIGIGIVVVAKQWMKPQAGAQPTAASTRTLQVKEELALDGKSTLRVIQWRDTQVLVASDAQGIRAVVPLTPAFSDALDSVEEELTLRDREPSSATLRSPEPPAAREPVPQRTEPTRIEPARSQSSSGIDDRLIQMLLNNANRSTAAKSYTAKGGA